MKYKKTSIFTTFYNSSYDGFIKPDTPALGTVYVKVYYAMKQAVADGKVHSIGLSNWYIKDLEEFLPQVSITPAVVHNESGKNKCNKAEYL